MGRSQASPRSRPTDRPRIIAGLLPLFALLLAGCHAAAPMRPVEIEKRTPEKDVLVFDIEVAEATSPRGYRDWAQEQLDSLGEELRSERHPGLPIYEVWYRFRRGGEALAEVSFRRSEDGRGPLVHDRTIVRATGMTDR